jgi:DNA-binding NarL/FixJ family response regulator
MTVRIVLVDDHRMFRSGVRTELAAETGSRWSRGRRRPRSDPLVPDPPDVVLLDCTSPRQRRPGGREY